MPLIRAPFKPPIAAADPIVKWVGGKRSLLSDLLTRAPSKFGTFYEPFLGGGAFFFSLAPARAVIGDLNPDLMDTYCAVRDEPEAVMSALDAMQPHVLDRDYYYEARRIDPQTLPAAKRAARFIYLNRTCYNGLYRVNRSGQFNVPFGRYATPPVLYDRINLERVAMLLRSADLRCADFEEILETAGEDDFAYLDPPYVPLTRTASFTSYTSGAFGEADQRRLGRVIRDLTDRGCRVLLSNSDTSLVRELYDGFALDVVYAPRSVNSNGSGRQKIPELAIRNYPVA